MNEPIDLEEYRRQKAIEEGKHLLDVIYFSIRCEATNTDFSLSREDVSFFDTDGDRMIIHFECPACGKQDEVIV